MPGGTKQREAVFEISTEDSSGQVHESARGETGGEGGVSACVGVGVELSESGSCGGVNRLDVLRCVNETQLRVGCGSGLDGRAALNEAFALKGLPDRRQPAGMLRVLIGGPVPQEPLVINQPGGQGFLRGGPLPSPGGRGRKLRL